MTGSPELLQFWKTGLASLSQYSPSQANGQRISFTSIATARPNARRHLATGCMFVFVIMLLFSYHLLLDSSRSPEEANSSSSLAPSPPSTLPGSLPVTFHLDEGEQELIPPRIDHFQSFKSSPTCQISSLEVFTPTKPVCKDKDSLMKAMMYGGRVGFDAPYQPRDCDLQWFSTAEICNILSRFSRIMLVGDSLARNMGIIFNIFFRKDLVHGGARDWDQPPPEAVANLDCTCQNITEVRDCSWWRGVGDTESVYTANPASMACPHDTSARLEYHVITGYPIAEDQLAGVTEALPDAKPEKPIALIMSHGLWNGIDYEMTAAWLHSVLGAVYGRAPWLMSSDKNDTLSPSMDSFSPPMLLITPSAASDKKPEAYSTDQNNLKLSIMEKKVTELIQGTGVDHLGMFNMSIQATSWDGTQATLRTDMLKCMMVFNWLNAYDLRTWTGWGGAI